MLLSCTGNEQKEIEKLLEADPCLHIYSIGDLDERFRPYTQWHGIRTSGRLEAVICIYTSTDTPTVMAIAENGNKKMAELLKETIPHLPPCFQAHLSPGLERLFTDTHKVELTASHYKMALLDYSIINTVDIKNAVRLDTRDIPLLNELYSKSYPGNWFEPEMLELNRYFGIIKKGRLLTAAGTHVYSPSHKAAALGNIATLPEYRNQGLGATATAALSRFMLNEEIRVGLNVKTDNSSAINCYKSIGFSICAEFGEFVMRHK